MSSSIYRAVNTTLIYIECGGEYLMLHRTKKENDCNRDKWIGIGGKFEEGESPEECALRETKEETGLALTSYRYRGIVTFVSDKWESEYMHLFTADGFEGTLKDCDEGELAWIKKKDLLALPAWEGDKIFLRLLDEKGVLITDNVLQDGDVIESHFAVERRNRTIHKRMREYLFELTHNPELLTSVVPLGDGIAITMKQQKTE